jgi:hypothetical protein
MVVKEIYSLLIEDIKREGLYRKEYFILGVLFLLFFLLVCIVLDYICIINDL